MKWLISGWINFDIYELLVRLQMSINVFLEKSGINHQANHFFDFCELDPFYSPDLLSVLFGEEWYSILITNDSVAFLSVFTLKSIPNSNYFDIEPFYGYNGPILSKDDEKFAVDAFNLYCETLNSINVVAELIRFHPLHSNHLYFKVISDVRIIASKPLVIINCYDSQAEIFNEYSTLRRRNIRLAISKGYMFRELTSDFEWESFKQLYYSTMDRVNSENKWYFDENFFIRNKKSNIIKLFGVYNENSLISAATFIIHPFLSHYFLAANHQDLYKGASELLIYETSRHLAAHGIKSLLLGGGASTNPNDSLLEFKKKFTKNPVSYYSIGGIVVNQEIFDKLNTEAISNNPEIANIKFFLKYRLG